MFAAGWAELGHGEVDSEPEHVSAPLHVHVELSRCVGRGNTVFCCVGCGARGCLLRRRRSLDEYCDDWLLESLQQPPPPPPFMELLSV